jgi:uncharacterized membrane protein
MYVLEKREDSVYIGYPAEERCTADTRYKIKAFLIWALIAIPITALGFIFGSIGHGVLFFIVLGFGGLYICVNAIKRAEISYFSVLLDREGVHEIWDYPHQKIEKTLRWEEIRYYNQFSRVIGGSCLGWWNVILFSAENASDRDRIKRIRKIWRSSMQYEIKYRDTPNNIYIVASPSQGEHLNQIILNFINETENCIQT